MSVRWMGFLQSRFTLELTMLATHTSYDGQKFSSSRCVVEMIRCCSFQCLSNSLLTPHHHHPGTMTRKAVMFVTIPLKSEWPLLLSTGWHQQLWRCEPEPTVGGVGQVLLLGPHPSPGWAGHCFSYPLGPPYHCTPGQCELLWGLTPCDGNDTVRTEMWCCG